MEGHGAWACPLRRLRLPPLPPPPLPVEELAPPVAPGELLEEPRRPVEGVGADPPGRPPEEAGTRGPPAGGGEEACLHFLNLDYYLPSVQLHLVNLIQLV